VIVDYPSLEEERQILVSTTGAEQSSAQPVLNPESLLALQSRPEDDSASALVKDSVAWGPGPRAAQALMLACRARALINGRLAPSMEDVVALSRPALSHRMALGFAAKAEGVTLETVIDAAVKRACG